MQTRYTITPHHKQHELRQFLDERGIKLKDAAPLIGISPSYLCNSMSGRCKFSSRVQLMIDRFVKDVLAREVVGRIKENR